MMLINGKEVSAFIKNKVKERIEKLPPDSKPALAVILVGDDPASRVYVSNKEKACELCGIKSVEYSLPAATTQDELLDLIGKLNADKEINGILCQLPLPSHISEKAVIDAIDPEKDVDCFSDSNVGRLWIGDYSFKPCTPAGVISLLDYYDISVSGRNCVIVGRSNIVGKPMAALLLERNATVTICHSKTNDLSSFTKNADLIVAAIGKAKFITAEMVKDGAVIIDVGINRDENGKLCGDVDFENVKDKCNAITPVPGGCGPMTIATLMENTLTAYLRQNEIEK